MKTLSSLVAVVSLFGAVALVPVVGGVLLGAVFVALFGLALVGVLAGLEDTAVPPRNPSMSPTRWRDGT